MLTEAMSTPHPPPPKEAFGKDRLREIMRECADPPAMAISAAVHERLASFRGAARQVDDVT
jgi:hypothetical protein